jgi:queuine tRNA-ribosyltransferase
VTVSDGGRAVGVDGAGGRPLYSPGSMPFDLQAEDSRARRGRVTTAHGSFETPAFMPVATQGTVKAITRWELLELNAEIILCNAYHLYLRPGPELVRAASGLHGFMGWQRPILTDSGGYQVFSLEGLRKVTEEGVTFRSHLDGSQHLMTPERAVEVQRALGADIMMCFDQPVPYPSDRAATEEATDRSDRWAERSRAAHGDCESPALFGIVQGGFDPELRARSAARVTALDFAGYALGGLSVGEPRAITYEMMEHTLPLLPADRPRYLMGVGTPDELVEAVARGVDMFDCVLPTRLGRNGCVFVSTGRLNMKNARHQDDFGPLDPGCDCGVCRHHSRAYLRHLYKAGEILAARLATYHNLYYYLGLMARMRAAIAEGRFESFRREFHARRQ